MLKTNDFSRRKKNTRIKTCSRIELNLKTNKIDIIIVHYHWFEQEKVELLLKVGYEIWGKKRRRKKYDE